MTTLLNFWSIKTKQRKALRFKKKKKSIKKAYKIIYGVSSMDDSIFLLGY